MLAFRFHFRVLESFLGMVGKYGSIVFSGRTRDAVWNRGTSEEGKTSARWWFRDEDRHWRRRSRQRWGEYSCCWTLSYRPSFTPLMFVICLLPAVYFSLIIGDLCYYLTHFEPNQETITDRDIFWSQWPRRWLQDRQYLLSHLRRKRSQSTLFSLLFLSQFCFIIGINFYRNRCAKLRCVSANIVLVNCCISERLPSVIVCPSRLSYLPEVQ